MAAFWPASYITLTQGLAYFLAALGIWLSFRVVGFADLTVDSSFTTGAAVAAVLVTAGVSPLSATLVALVAGLAAGLVTGLVHAIWRIQDLLAGILMLTALYSVNLRIMGGANVPLLTQRMLSDQVGEWLGLGSGPIAGIIVVAIFAVVVGGLVWWFLHTGLGLGLRATGNNQRMVAGLGINTQAMLVLGLALSNGLVALSGALVAQQQGFADIGMGIGLLVIGLAAIILGENLLRAVREGRVGRAIVAVAAGSLIYRLVIVLALRAGLHPQDLKLATAALVLLVLLPARRRRRAQTVSSH